MGHYQQISDRFLQYLKSDVDMSVALGLPDNLARLGDPSMEAFELALAAARQLLEEIDEGQAEDFYQQLDLQLMSRHLRRDIFFRTLTFNGELHRRQKPGGADGIGEGIFQLFVNDERESQARLRDILARLQQAPDYQVDGKSHSSLQSALIEIFGKDVVCTHKEYTSQFDCSKLFKPR